MKRVVFLLFFLFIAYFNLYPQVTIGSGKPPESFSVLELDSHEGGLRLNQLTPLQKDNLENKIDLSSKPEEGKGLTIFDMQEKAIEYWSGSTWAQLIGVSDLGEEGQFLKSNGPGKLPEWVALKIPKVNKEDYYLSSSQVLRDEVGIVLGDKPDDMTTYNLNDPLDSNWEVIDGLTTTVNIPTVENVPSGKAATRMSIEFQAGGQIATGWRSFTADVRVHEPAGYYVTLSWTIIPAVGFAVGIFVDDQLKLVRIERIEANGGGNSFGVYTVIGTIENLSPGPQTVKVAVRRRNSVNMEEVEAAKRSISIGRHIDAGQNTNYNPFMGQSSLRVDVYSLNTEG